VPPLAELLCLAAARLSASPHPDRARRDAESLLLHLVGRNKAWLIAHGDEDLDSDRKARFAELVERRFIGEPIQYITGETEFFGLPFRVNPDVLIPRPETEHLVEKVLDLAAGFKQPHIVDVGTGSGAIAVALASKLAEATITAIDLSPASIGIASQNAHRNGVASLIRFLEGDLLSPVAAEAFEIVVSNPPYVPATEHATLAAEVREYEPALALFAGEDGLSIYRRLIPQARAVLIAGGFLVFEIGFSQQEAVETLLAGFGFRPIEFLTDLQGIPRVACAQWPGFPTPAR
jgi:release factor glutamine methyltransferase